MGGASFPSVACYRVSHFQNVDHAMCIMHKQVHGAVIKLMSEAVDSGCLQFL